MGERKNKGRRFFFHCLLFKQWHSSLPTLALFYALSLSLSHLNLVSRHGVTVQRIPLVSEGRRRSTKKQDREKERCGRVGECKKKKKKASSSFS